MQVRMPLAEMFWGDRMGTVTDRWGNEWSLAQQRKQAVAPSLLADEAKPGLISTATGLPIIPKAEHNDLSGYRSHLRSFFQSADSEGFKIDQDCAWPQLTAQPDRRVGVAPLDDLVDLETHSGRGDRKGDVYASLASTPVQQKSYANVGGAAGSMIHAEF